MTLDHAWHLFPHWLGAMWNISSVDPCFQLWKLSWKVQLCLKSCLMIWFYFYEKSSGNVNYFTEHSGASTVPHLCQYQNEELAHSCCHCYLLYLLRIYLTSQLKMRISLCCVYTLSLTCSWTSQNSSPQPLSARRGLPEWAVGAANLRE